MSRAKSVPRQRQRSRMLRSPSCDAPSEGSPYNYTKLNIKQDRLCFPWQQSLLVRSWHSEGISLYDAASPDRSYRYGADVSPSTIV